MRKAFIETLLALAENDEKIFLLCGDLGFSVLEPFAEKYPSRFLNVGIAEQNMAGIAAGLAFEGYSVFTYSIGNFPILRAMEQIRYDICYHNANVKIVAVGAGYSYGPLGVSHHCTEDLGMLRTIPNLIVCSPGDPIETECITRLISVKKGPCYLRIGKAGEPIVHKKKPEIIWGKMVCLKEGAEILVIATGSMLSYAAEFIEKNKLNWGLWSAPFVKPIDYGMLASAAVDYTKIITMEEHQIYGGLGSAVLEALNDLREEVGSIPIVKRIAIPDKFIGYAGSQAYLRKCAGLELTIEYF